MDITKGQLYVSKNTGTIVKALSSKKVFGEIETFQGEVASIPDDVLGYSVGEIVKNFSVECFEPYISPILEEKMRVKEDLINSINIIFSNDENTCENLNEVRDYISNLMITDF
jgi:hypothetical protein